MYGFTYTAWSRFLAKNLTHEKQKGIAYRILRWSHYYLYLSGVMLLYHPLPVSGDGICDLLLTNRLLQWWWEHLPVYVMYDFILANYKEILQLALKK